MKTRLEIFSSEKLQNFFSNLDTLFDISLKSLSDLKDNYDSKNLSIVFFEDKDFIKKQGIFNSGNLEKIYKKNIKRENDYKLIYLISCFQSWYQKWM